MSGGRSAVGSCFSCARGLGREWFQDSVMNKWVILSCFLLWARHGEGGALKCLPEDEACSAEQTDQIEQQEIEIRRPIGADTDAPAECLPGSEWDSNCHNCRCSAEGAADCLRRPDCEYIEEPIRCKPNSTFARECNTCVCLESGLGLCTVKPCQRISSETSASVKSKASMPQGVSCAPGTKWLSQCNSCHCLSNGLSSCTEKACPEQETEAPLDCAPHSQWRRDCNMCWCTPSGRAMCTKMGCGGSPVVMNFDDKKDAPENPPEMNNLPEVPDMNSNVLPELDAKMDFNNNVEEEHFTKEREDLIEEHLTDVNLKDLDDFDHNDVDTPIKIPGQIITEFATNANDDSKVVDRDIELLEELLDHNNEDQRAEGDLTETHSSKGVNRDIEVLETPYLDHINNQRDVTHRVQKRSACKPNQEFQNDCNTCKCSASGQSYTCTQNECMDSDKEEVGKDKEVDKEVEVFMESEGVDHIERHSVCKPSTTFYNNCNACHCNEDGTDFTCTDKPCPLPADVEVFHELHAVKSAPKNGTKKVCVENRMFILNCNTCWCNEDGTSYFCTRKVCVQDSEEPVIEEGKPEQSLRIIKKECRPDEVFELDCNMCRCNPDGKSFSCTRRACFDEEHKNLTRSRKVRATPQEAPKTCQPGQEFRLDCNKCLCDNEGQDFSCTRIDCAALNSNNGARSRRDVTSQKVSADCVPGSVFDQGCNVCRCTEDGGHATCTLKRCVQSSENSTASATESSFRCNPGEQFKQSCNDCSCSADGKSVFCTLLVCDEDLTP